MPDAAPQRSIIVAPSILSADFARLGDEVRAADAAGGDWIHVDVMDGRFVPNITIGPVVVAALRKATKKPLDVHLMIVEPERYLDAFAEAGADHLLVHCEPSSTVHLHRTLGHILDLGKTAGVVLNPATGLDAIEHVLDLVGIVLVMTVNPGFGGQKFIASMLPKIRAKPAFLTSQHLEIVRGQQDSSPTVPATPENIAALAAGQLRLRQAPGEDNALGLVKFIFPNTYNVYLHSTPAHQLFKETRRAFSHGCIRVSDPLALAQYVLRDAPGEWSAAKISAALNGAATLRVDLPQPINVLILYGTALATEAGPTLFFDDIYGYDRRLEHELGLTAIR